MINRLVEMVRQRRGRKTLYSTEEYWDSKAALFQDTAVSMWPNRVLNDLYDAEQKRVIADHFSRVDSRTLLDLGCGTGRFSRWFASQGAAVVGVDFSRDSLAIARGIAGAGDNPTYRHGSVFELDDLEGYDLVFTWGVLTIACRDTSELFDALTRIRSALKPGGKLLLTEPVHRGFLHRVLDLGLPQFLDVMRKAGFEIDATTPLHFWPMRLALSYIQWPAWITVPGYHLGQALMKLPGLSRLGDYWAISAHAAPRASE